MRKMEPCGAFRDPIFFKETGNRKSKLQEKVDHEEWISYFIFIDILCMEINIILKRLTSLTPYCNLFILICTNIF